MGDWGAGIFSNDIAADVRGEFRDLLGDGLSTDEATRELIGRYQTEDPDEVPPFWLALAATQWKLGRLLPDVRDRALAVIDDGTDLARWVGVASAADVRKRAKALAALRDQLGQPLPEPKRVARRFRPQTPYMVGDLLAYRLRSGRFTVLRVTAIHTDVSGSAPIVEFLPVVGSELPREEDVTTCPPRIPARKTYSLPYGERVVEGHACTRNIIFRWSQRDDPSSRLQVIGNGSPVSALPVATGHDDPNAGIGVCWWRDLDGYLSVVYGLG